MRGRTAPAPAAAAASASWLTGRDGSAGLERLERGDSAGEGADLHDPQAGRDGALRVGAVAGRGEEHGRTRVARADHFLLDTADGRDRPVGRDLPRAGDEPAARSE